MAPAPPPPQVHITSDGLPKPFVTALKTLFDIMDDKNTGFVKLTDIEARWQDDGSKGLPKDVMDHLKKVAPQNGLLSFERFCSGLKMSLLKNQAEERKNENSQPVRPPSAPALDLDKKQSSRNSNTAAVRPNNVLNAHRTISMPQLPGDKKEAFDQMVGLPTVNKAPLYGPPKPPRTGVGLIANNTERNIDKAEIRTALQNWQMGIIMNEDEKRAMAARQRSVGDGCNDQTLSQQSIPQQQQMFKKPANKRREPRRHTLQNGIDYNMLKRMKQIELERDVLMQGLQSVDKAKEWYAKQIANVQEKMKYLGRMGSHTDQWSESQQERIELQRARVLEVNRHLAMLTESTERGGLPLHMNLAFHHPVPHLSATAAPTTYMLNRLKQQNTILSEEVNSKTERITSLEREKASLIRELYQNRIQK